ncbi:hypothetical protein N1851_003764 [Merluccius polli]|uniref:Tyr recombinase domain-containing protein n=1 Tax=Merluccius polli TaxID=89951 RepID=A0AA47N9H5_MERPO|nr:hypothetical protein N1851_003764 [Merluccius polli]
MKLAWRTTPPTHWERPPAPLLRALCRVQWTRGALARLGLDAPQTDPGQTSAFFRRNPAPATFTVPPSEEYVKELHACWRDSRALSHSTTDARTLAAMQDAAQVGLGRMPPVEPAIASLILAPDEALRPDARWKLFSDWCNGKAADPVRCPVAIVLEFLQSLLDSGRSHSTLRVYVAAISSRHEGVDGATVGCHRLVSLFLRGALRLRPPRTLRAPAWDLPLVLEAMSLPPFEPLTQVGLKWLSMKVAFLLAITSAKRVGELQALSVAETCLRWNPDGSGVVLWPNVAFLPKVLSRTHLNQPIRLARFDSPSEEGRSELLCPVRALRAYIAATAGIRQSEQLFVCHGGPNRGCALSKQRLSHWVVDAITHAYGASGRPPPSGVRCHSTRSVATSWAALRGVPLEAICAAASWATPGTFTRFYRVNVADHCPMAAVLRPSGCWLLCDIVGMVIQCFKHRLWRSVRMK